MSDWEDIYKGVLQGSILDPVLFLKNIKTSFIITGSRIMAPTIAQFSIFLTLASVA
jgi:hypothetical protein